MEYERIHQVQTGLISPSKLRMKLMGPHHGRKKVDSNTNSSRTSPSKLEDNEFVKNGLLASKTEDSDDEVATSNLEVATLNIASEVTPDCKPSSNMPVQSKESLPKENSNAVRAKMQQFSKNESSNSSAIHPVRTTDDENLDYDSNASSSSFEFHKERSGHGQFTRSFSRHMMPSKWNDAEKWIMNRQIHQHNPKKNHSQNQSNRTTMTNTVRVAPESANCDPKQFVSKVTDTRRQDFAQPASQTVFDKFSFASGTQLVPGQAYGGNASIDQCTPSKDLLEIDQRELHCTRTSGDDATVVPVIRSVCMRDMGTEMTPGTSLEPSRTATPIDATTPLRSPVSSIPSTPRRGAPASTPLEHFPDAETHNASENGKKDLTEQELKQKTRREIVALGMQLGKMNIAAWASKEDREKKSPPLEHTVSEELERIEFEKRAAAWEEAEKAKHMARYKREEIKIQAWESQQKARLEAEMRRIEAQVEQMRAQAQGKMVKNNALARQRSDEKRAASEARKSRDAEQTAAKAEYIRRTGRIPSSFICCGW